MSILIKYGCCDYQKKSEKTSYHINVKKWTYITQHQKYENFKEEKEVTNLRIFLFNQINSC